MGHVAAARDARLFARPLTLMQLQPDQLACEARYAGHVRAKRNGRVSVRVAVNEIAPVSRFSSIRVNRQDTGTIATFSR
jgi:hypothetical protein